MKFKKFKARKSNKRNGLKKAVNVALIIKIAVSALALLTVLGVVGSMFSGNSDDDGTKPPATKPTVTVAPEETEVSEETESSDLLPGEFYFTFVDRYNNNTVTRLKACEGMTWDTWIDSDYNTIDFQTDFRCILDRNGQIIIFVEGDYCFDTLHDNHSSCNYGDNVATDALIIPNAFYTLYA